MTTMFIRDLDVEDFLQTVDDMTAIGPLINPGQCDGNWLDTAHQWETIARAVQTFQKSTQDIHLPGE